VAVLPGSGIDLERFRPVTDPEIGAAARPVVFLLVARLLWDKGVGEFVEAARRIRAERGDASFCLLGFLDAHNQTAIPPGVVEGWVAEGLIEYLGATDDVRPFLAAADCVVLPSYREGTPRSLLEAAAMGRPLIATDAPGCRDVVEEGVNGYLCAVRDPASLAAAMTRFLDLDLEARAAMGQASRAMAERDYDEALVIDAYRRAIKGICAARAAPA
jgi:glycosyltransferase involved in cell wall biosynthesis